MIKKIIIPIELLLFFMLIFSTISYGEEPHPRDMYDIVVYGGTSAGVLAAAQASKMGKSVVLISPEKHLGGITSNGLGWVDINNFKIVGGLTWKYFNKVWQFYQKDSSWIWEKKHPIKGQLMEFHQDIPLMWVLEPHVGERIFNAIVFESKILVIRNERLNRNNGVLMDGQRIGQITMESGLSFKGKMFIDATYEGDLMASSNVSYIVGREPNTRYQETMNGIQFNIPNANKFINIDPYITKADPQSGLLPRIYSDAGGNAGDGDNGVQAYSYRMCLTDVPQNSVPIDKPKNYDEFQYEILFRALEAGIPAEDLFKLDLLPNRKTDSNNSGLISTDYVGMSWSYAEADYATRTKIALEHEEWQRGLIWTLQNHPRVPSAVQTFYAPWGLPKDEFIDNNHWPYMLYIREARRMVSPLVIDEQAVLGNVPVLESIGLADYSLDSHAVKYIVNSNGFLESEGGLFKKILNAYPISFQAIIPAKQECENLLVPVCLSASHVAYASIRMEPTFMILGQSAATAASLSIDLNVAIQDLPYTTLRQQLLSDKQILD
jgi:hypothetical protein